jgi:hypothetical protein
VDDSEIVKHRNATWIKPFDMIFPGNRPYEGHRLCAISLKEVVDDGRICMHSIRMYWTASLQCDHHHAQ